MNKAIGNIPTEEKAVMLNQSLVSVGYTSLSLQELFYSCLLYTSFRRARWWTPPSRRRQRTATCPLSRAGRRRPLRTGRRQPGRPRRERPRAETRGRDRIAAVSYTHLPELTSRFSELVKEVPVNHLELSCRIIEDAQKRLNVTFSDAIYIGLSDHISYALYRSKQKLPLKNNLLWEIKRFYPREYQACLLYTSRCRFPGDTECSGICRCSLRRCREGAGKCLIWLQPDSPLCWNRPHF